MRAIILAGGFGTRLSTRVASVPKPMAPIDGRPFLEYILDRLIINGIVNITISVGYRCEYIISHFSDSYKDARINYSIESEPLGTGGAVLHSLQNTLEQSVLVINGDTLVDIDYKKYIQWYYQRPNSLSIVLKRMDDISRYGSVTIMDERITGFVEKGQKGPGLINAGVYIITTNIFTHFALMGKFSLEKDLFQQNIHNINLRPYITDSYFIDIGIPEDYDRAQEELPYRF